MADEPMPSDETPQERYARITQEGLARGEAMKKRATGQKPGVPSISDYTNPETEIPTQRWYVGYEWSPYSSTPRKQYVENEKSALDYFYSFDPSQLNRLNKAASASAGYKVPDTWNQSIWEKAVKKAQFDSKKYGVEVSPWDYIDAAASAWDESGGAKKKAGKYIGPVTNVDIVKTPAADVEVTLNNMAMDMLGRNLTPDELSKYTKQFNKAEMESPQVSVTTPTMKGKQSVGSTQITKPTVDRSTIAKQILQSNPAFVDKQINTDVIDMIMNDIEKGRAVISD